MAETLALVSAITALCAVLLGPLVSLWAALKQSRVTVLSGNRQAWINTLRDLIAEYIAIVAVVHAGDWAQKSEEEFDQKLERLTLIRTKITLMINPNEEDHERLVKLLQAISQTLGGRAAGGEKRDMKKAAELHNELCPLAQAILKREWERVKQTR